MADLSSPHIVITGNPVDGCQYHGPFTDYNAASDFTEGAACRDCSDWWIAPIASGTPIAKPAPPIVGAQGDENRHRVSRAKDMRASWASYAQVPLNEVQIRDTLADLMHLAKAEGVEFDHELSMATDFFGDETSE